MYRIKKRFDFSASHQLTGLPADHQCARLHGHNYSVTVILQGDKLNDVGFIKDYGELSVIKDYLDRTVEHRHLNEVFDFNPTAELMAQYFFEVFCCMEGLFEFLQGVEVKETDKTSALYSPYKPITTDL